MQSIGIEDDITPDIQQMMFSKDMTLLLCSDGLTDMLSEPEIRSILAHPEDSLEMKARALVDNANKAGGRQHFSHLDHESRLKKEIPQHFYRVCCVIFIWQL